MKRSNWFGFAGLVAALGLVAGCVGDGEQEQLGTEREALAAPPMEMIAVDIDQELRGISPAEARAQFDFDTMLAEPVLTAAAASAAGSPDAFGAVGDVRPMYTYDGWIDFELRAADDNAEIWVAPDLAYCGGVDPRPAPVVTDEQVAYLLNEFSTNIYPSNTGYFGETNPRSGAHGALAGYPWYRADDNPQRVMIMVYNILDEGYCDPDYGFYVAGYYWGWLNNVVDRNIIHIDAADWANRIGPDAAIPHLYEQVFTHEYEHAIHGDHDPDEVSWIDEGMADLAPYLAGYGHSAGHLAYYLVYHRLTSLTAWGGGLEDYGASYLFQLYLNEHFGGPDFIRDLVDEPANGIEGINAQLAANGFAADFDDVYRDWTVANYLDDATQTGVSGAGLGYDTLVIGSGDTWGYTIPWAMDNVYESPTHHGNIPLPRYYPGGYTSGTVEYPVGSMSPYSPRYTRYRAMQPELVATLNADAGVGEGAYSGTHELYGGRANMLDNSAATGPVTLGAGASLSFMTNFVIEENWDFAFVQVLELGTAAPEWVSLSNANTTDICETAVPAIADRLPGLTGSSDGWREETFDLSAFEGSEVIIRFVYATDEYYTDRGFYVDNVVVSDATGVLFSDNLDAGSDAWFLDGFEHTTGLSDCDWQVTAFTPVYSRGRLMHHDFADAESFQIGGGAMDYARLSLDTLDMGRGTAVVVLSNRMTERDAAPADFFLHVEKGTAAH